MMVQRRVYTFFEDRTLSITYISQGSPYTVHLLQSQRGKEFASTLFLQPGASYEQGKWSDPWTLMPDIVRLSGTSCGRMPSKKPDLFCLSLTISLPFC